MCLITTLGIPARQFNFFFSSRRRHTRGSRDWSSDVCSSDLTGDNVTVFADPSDTVTKLGTNDIVVAGVDISKANQTVTVTDSDNLVDISGSNDTVTITGTNDIVTFSANKTTLTLTASGETIHISGNNDTVLLSGNNNT